jgi:hypothetical protein
MRDAVGFAVIALVLATMAALLVLGAQLLGRLEWLRTLGRAPDYFPTRPDRRGYYLLGWIWTDGHRLLDDVRTTRLVLALRVMIGLSALTYLSAPFAGRLG